MTRSDAGESRPGAPVSSPARSYLLVMALVVLTGLGLAWAWSARMKLAFLDPEYAAWSAKQEMVARCDLGQMLILGDSRADAGIMPNRLSIRSENIAVGGAKPVELYYFLQHALACVDMPKHVLLSLDVGHFDSTDTFWERSARFGTFTTRDLDEIQAVARRTGDETLFRQHHSDGFPAPLRNWLYANSFPTLNFGSMVRGGLFLRYDNNLAERQKTLLARGQHLFGNAAGNFDATQEADRRPFRILPLEEYFFDRMIHDMQDRGIAVDYVVMPISETTAARAWPERRDGFAAFLNRTARRYPNFHILIGPYPSMPDHLFGDGFGHLNQTGSERFSTILDGALRRAAAASP